MPTENTDTDPAGAPPTDLSVLEAAKAAVSRLGREDLHALRAWLDARLAAPDADPGGADLSDRESEVARLTALGYGNKEIAAQLKVAAKTVETYKRRAMQKLHVRSRADIVRYAVRRGWLGADAAGAA